MNDVKNVVKAVLQERLRLQLPYPRILSICPEQLLVCAELYHPRIVHVSRGHRQLLPRNGDQAEGGGSQYKVCMPRKVAKPVR